MTEGIEGMTTDARLCDEPFNLFSLSVVALLSANEVIVTLCLISMTIISARVLAPLPMIRIAPLYIIALF